MKKVTRLCQMNLYYGIFCCQTYVLLGQAPDVTVEREPYGQTGTE
jgi:hypothetical protein